MVSEFDFADLINREFEIGELIDCMDKAQKWCIASIVEVQLGFVKVHFEGWSTKWDDWYSKSSFKLQPAGTFTVHT